MIYKVGQIFFWNDTSFFGKLIKLYNIKKFKQSHTTHCGIISKIDKDAVLIHEAGDKGFNSSWYGKDWLDTKIKEGIVHIKETKEPLKDVFENCEKYKGIGYGWLDIIGLCLNFLFNYKLIGITGSNKLICSEAVSRVLYDSSKTINIAEEYGIKYDAVTPEHIFLSKQVK